MDNASFFNTKAISLRPFSNAAIASRTITPPYIIHKTSRLCLKKISGSAIISKIPHKITNPAPQLSNIPFRSSGRKDVYSIPTICGITASIVNSTIILPNIKILRSSLLIMVNMILNYSATVNLSIYCTFYKSDFFYILAQSFSRISFLSPSNSVSYIFQI